LQSKVKIFPLRLQKDKHLLIKNGAAKAKKSMHQFILDSTENEIKENQKNVEAYNLIRRAYGFIEGGPDADLEKALRNWLLKENE
jgi:uncharacterized protein (DUF1778 family)